MQTKHLCVLIHIWTKSEVGTPLNRLKHSSKIFTDRSKAVLFCGSFMGFFLFCVCYAFVRVCLYVPCGHLLGKGWPLGFRLWCLTVSLSLSHWYPGSDMVLDCIDSWTLHPYLLWNAMYILSAGMDQYLTSMPSVLIMVRSACSYYVCMRSVAVIQLPTLIAKKMSLHWKLWYPESTNV